MGQSTKSPPNHSSSSWDGKCQNCRKLMSSCICFQESESNADPLHTSASDVIADASQTRPLWNALRKMHRNSTGTRLALVQLPQSSSSSLKEHNRNRSEALPPLSASDPSTSSSRHHLHRRPDARSPQSSRHGSREPRREPSPERSSLSRKDGLQHAGSTSSSHNFKRDAKDAGVMRSVQSTYSINKHNSISVDHHKEKFSYGPEEGFGPDEIDGTVWEL